MYILALLVNIVVSLFLIIVVLLQSGKAADLAGAFGGMGSQTAFGPRGSATLLSMATTISAVLFMITSLSLSILASRSAGLGTTVLQDVQQKNTPAKSAPAPVQVPQVPQGPMTMTPEGGQPITLPPPTKELPPNRRSSPTFGMWEGARLSAQSKNMLWVPIGFAHGFCALSDFAEVLYKATDFYAPEHERCILWNDPELKIEWPLPGAPLLSPKDAAGVRLRDAEVFP